MITHTVEQVTAWGYTDTTIQRPEFPSYGWQCKVAQSLNVTLDSLHIYRMTDGQWRVFLSTDAHGPYKSEPLLP